MTSNAEPLIEPIGEIYPPPPPLRRFDQKVELQPSCVFCLAPSTEDCFFKQKQTEEDWSILYDFLQKLFSIQVPAPFLWKDDDVIPLCNVCHSVGIYLVKLYKDIEYLNVELFETASRIKKAVNRSENDLQFNKKQIRLGCASKVLRDGILKYWSAAFNSDESVVQIQDFFVGEGSDDDNISEPLSSKSSTSITPTTLSFKSPQKKNNGDRGYDHNEIDRAAINIDSNDLTNSRKCIELSGEPNKSSRIQMPVEPISTANSKAAHCEMMQELTSLEGSRDENGERYLIMDVGDKCDDSLISYEILDDSSIESFKMDEKTSERKDVEEDEIKIIRVKKTENEKVEIEQKNSMDKDDEIQIIGEKKPEDRETQLIVEESFSFSLPIQDQKLKVHSSTMTSHAGPLIQPVGEIMPPLRRFDDKLEQQLSCVFCLALSTEDCYMQTEEDLSILYDLLQKFFNLQVPRSVLWNFDVDAIPLCKVCLGVGMYLVKLHKEIESLNVELFETASQIKRAVNRSEKVWGKNSNQFRLDLASKSLRDGILQYWSAALEDEMDEPVVQIQDYYVDEGLEVDKQQSGEFSSSSETSSTESRKRKNKGGGSGSDDYDWKRNTINVDSFGLSKPNEKKGLEVPGPSKKSSRTRMPSKSVATSINKNRSIIPEITPVEVSKDENGEYYIIDDEGDDSVVSYEILDDSSIESFMMDEETSESEDKKRKENEIQIVGEKNARTSVPVEEQMHKSVVRTASDSTTENRFMVPLTQLAEVIPNLKEVLQKNNKSGGPLKVSREDLGREAFRKLLSSCSTIGDPSKIFFRPISAIKTSFEDGDFPQNCEENPSNSKARKKDRDSRNQNDREKQRRHMLQSTLGELKSLVPKIKDSQHCSKVQILTDATVYIEYLKKEQSALANRVDTLKQRQETLKTRLAQFQMEEG